MIFNNNLSYSALCERCFLFLNPLGKWRKEFFTSVLCLFLSIKGKINFLQLSRYSASCEQRYRQNFEKPFDFLAFNTALVQEHCSCEKVIAFDPAYIPKAGKKTCGKGTFWSGSVGAPQKGLELCGIAALDLENRTAMHLEAIQTKVESGETLLEHYAKMLIDRKEMLLTTSNIVVVDAYFSKEPFVSMLTKEGFEVISRLRDDVNIKYLIEKQLTGKKGRPKTIGEKINVRELDTSYFQQIKTENPEERIYTGIVQAVALKTKVRVVIVQKLLNGQIKDVKIYFSTDTKMSGEKILDCYGLRFQIEFLYRDAKQHTGLAHCQARGKEKLHFHFNSSLTAVSVAKARHWLSIEKSKRSAFSMTDIKTINHNELLLKRFIHTFGINPNTIKNKQYIKELLSLGTIAA
jgi:hypothetical protein